MFPWKSNSRGYGIIVYNVYIAFLTIWYHVHMSHKILFLDLLPSSTPPFQRWLLVSYSITNILHSTDRLCFFRFSRPLSFSLFFYGKNFKCSFMAVISSSSETPSQYFIESNGQINTSERRGNTSVVSLSC